MKLLSVILNFYSCTIVNNLKIFYSSKYELICINNGLIMSEYCVTLTKWKPIIVNVLRLVNSTECALTMFDIRCTLIKSLKPILAMH